ncbi:hypothetical protein Ndes2526A_g06189 [Nannochloris sp. 'desiccata']|nr:hypothetical protein KSW81_008031 [Chlorella desiccata (nom. nud.)]
MGGSLRRHKRHNPKVRKRKHKKPATKSLLPKEVTAQLPDIKKKLGIDPTWNQAGNIESNYEHLGFAADVNAGTGRNRRSDILANKVPQIPDDQLDASLDEDLKVAMAQQRNSGKAPPKRPTPRQRQLIERLLAAHGSNVAAMVRDRKLNAMQHSEGVLQSLIESCDYWRGNTGVDFRAPIKSI